MSENKTINTLENKYQTKSEIEHVLDRSGMWLGSTVTDIIEYPLFIPSKNKIQLLPNIGYNSGLLKLIDEVLSNSVDEFRRVDSLFRISKISIEINSDGSVTITDNGGIPVQLHKQTGLLIPELIFGHLRTSSNYDDTQDRDVVGTNGLGSKISNIFSKNFSIETCDGHKKVKIDWSNNMRNVNKDLEKYPKYGFNVTETKEHYTKISYKLDLERFEIDEFSLQFLRIVQKRCIDASASNPGLNIEFISNIAEGKLNSEWCFNSFTEYINLYLDEKQNQNKLVFNNKKDNIIIVPENIGFNFGFVNGAVCSEGSHIKKIQNQITDVILDYCKKNDMELITEKDILQRISIFVNCHISNPKYDSQAKKTLTNKIDKFTLLFSPDFIKAILNSEIIENIKIFYETKYAEEKKKELRKLNSTIKTTKIKKLIQPISKDASRNELWLFEGTSASNGFRKARNFFQSAYLLRGKILNTFNLERSQILENIELREVLACSNLLFNESTKNLKSCNFDKFVFATDMDHDGNHIAGLLVAFFAKNFPELFKAGKIYRALSPIIVCTPLTNKKLEKKYYYSVESFKNDEHNLKGYEINYTKGLGGLDDEDYKEMLRNQKLIKFTLDSIKDIECIAIWFDKNTEFRKQIIMDDTKS